MSLLGSLSTSLSPYHKEFNIITDKQWDDWLWIWKDSEGFEVYERADRTYATVGIYEAIGGPEPQKLEFREVVDQLQNAFYQKQEELEGQQYPREIRHILMKAWVRSLGRFVGEFRRNAADEIMRQLSAGCNGSRVTGNSGNIAGKRV